MKVSLSTDEAFPHREVRAGDVAYDDIVDVPPKRIERWKRAIRLYNKVQEEMEKAIEDANSNK